MEPASIRELNEMARFGEEDLIGVIARALGRTASRQRLKTMEEKGVVVPTRGGKGPGHHRRYTLLDVIAADTAARWMKPYDALPAGRELGYSAGQFWQLAGLENVWRCVEQGLTVLMPLLDAYTGLDGQPPTMIAPEDRPLRRDGTPVLWPDLQRSVMAARDVFWHVLRRQAKRHARRHPTDSADAARAIDALTALLRLRMGVAKDAE